MIIKNKPVNISVDRLKPAYLLVTDSIPDKTTVPCEQSDENSAANNSKLLTDDKPNVSRHGRFVKKPNLVSQRIYSSQTDEVLSISRRPPQWMTSHFNLNGNETLTDWPKRVVRMKRPLTLCLFIENSTQRKDLNSIYYVVFYLRINETQEHPLDFP
ncbi:hypothetical protein TNCV_1194711 [Trichonephila clavipes]|nr:hypothetical protein TNCV_1194711 [Trichonephila clavipes]